MSNEHPQIVITGAGLITSLGQTRAENWKAICDARCGVGTMTVLEQPLAPGKDGGQAVELVHASTVANTAELPREAKYLRQAILDALKEADINIDSPSYLPDRSAIIIGTTLHGMRAGGRFLRDENFDHLKQFLAGSTLDLATKGLPFSGLATTTCSACSSSLGSIALAATLLAAGQYDVVIAGGYDTISEYVYGGFNSLRLVADGPLKPFSRNRQGMKLAEGYGIVILERAADAKMRGVKPLAEIAGWGESADSHHLTQPHPKGDGAARAMQEAIARASLTPQEINLLAAHATGTPDNDAAEYAAMSATFGNGLINIPVVGFKSHLGHTLGGAGAVELILSMMALEHQIIPPCANTAAEEIDFPMLNVAREQTVPAKIRATLNTSLGFGGANTSVVLTALREPTLQLANASSLREVCISGVGVIYPGVLSNQMFINHLAKSNLAAWERKWESVSETDLEGLLSARRVRRMSEYVKLQLAATTLSIRDAGIIDVPAFAEHCSSIVGTMHGSAGYSYKYYEQIVREGISAANPMLFAEGVPNGAAAQLSLMLGIKGSCQTIIGTRTSGLDALNLATSRIATGVWDRAIIGAAEEKCDIIEKAYQHCGLARKEPAAIATTDKTGFVYGPGAVAIILESRESIAGRQGIAKGIVTSWSACKSELNRSSLSLANSIGKLGETDAVIASWNSTWIDRAEMLALRSSDQKRVVTSMYGHTPEMFSATPLLGIAAVLLSGRLPRLLGSFATSDSFLPASGQEQPKSFLSIASDFSGAAAVTRIEIA